MDPARTHQDSRRAAQMLLRREFIPSTLQVATSAVLEAAWLDGGDPLLYGLCRIAMRIGHRQLWRALKPHLGEEKAEEWLESRLELGELLVTPSASGNGGWRRCWVEVNPTLDWPCGWVEVSSWLKREFGATEKKLGLFSKARVQSSRGLAVAASKALTNPAAYEKHRAPAKPKVFKGIFLDR